MLLGVEACVFTRLGVEEDRVGKDVRARNVEGIGDRLDDGPEAAGNQKDFGAPVLELLDEFRDARGELWWVFRDEFLDLGPGGFHEAEAGCEGVFKLCRSSHRPGRESFLFFELRCFFCQRKKERKRAHCYEGENELRRDKENEKKIKKTKTQLACQRRDLLPDPEERRDLVDALVDAESRVDVEADGLGGAPGGQDGRGRLSLDRRHGGGIRRSEFEVEVVEVVDGRSIVR